MAVSQAQIVDLLYKEAFGVTKTDTAANKSPSNESIPSPALNRGDTHNGLSLIRFQEQPPQQQALYKHTLVQAQYKLQQTQPLCPLAAFIQLGKQT